MSGSSEISRKTGIAIFIFCREQSFYKKYRNEPKLNICVPSIKRSSDGTGVPKLTLLIEELNRVEESIPYQKSIFKGRRKLSAPNTGIAMMTAYFKCIKDDSAIFCSWTVSEFACAF